MATKTPDWLPADFTLPCLGATRSWRWAGFKLSIPRRQTDHALTADQKHVFSLCFGPMVCLPGLLPVRICFFLQLHAAPLELASPRLAPLSPGSTRRQDTSSHPSLLSLPPPFSRACQQPVCVRPPGLSRKSRASDRIGRQQTQKGERDAFRLLAKPLALSRGSSHNLASNAYDLSALSYPSP